MKANRIVRRVKFAGVAEAARRLGCSREHLSRVLHGQRKANDDLRRRLAKMGVTKTECGKEI